MQFIAIVQKLVMSTFPHLGSGARQGVVSSRYFGMLIPTQYLHSTHWTHTCVVLLAGGWAGGGTVIAARRVSPPPPPRHCHWSPGTWPAQLASSRLQTPARRLHWAQLSGSVYTFISYHTFITLPLLSVFHFLFAVETLESVF